MSNVKEEEDKNTVENFWELTIVRSDQFRVDHKIIEDFVIHRWYIVTIQSGSTYLQIVPRRTTMGEKEVPRRSSRVRSHRHEDP